jgi:carbonic anhydrase/acetyltransferase-like protein (isoleucine patch superfamily)
MTIRTFEGISPRLGARVHVDDTALVLGRVVLGEDVSVWPQAVLRGDVQEIHVGARSNIQDGAVLHVSHDSPYNPGGVALEVGEGVTVGHRVVLHACTVGDGAFIGVNSVVLDRAVIEPRAMLGAGSLVPPGRVIEGGWLWLGQPARRARRLSERELEYMTYIAGHYVRLKERHRGGAR